MIDLNRKRVENKADYWCISSKQLDILGVVALYYNAYPIVAGHKNINLHISRNRGETLQSLMIGRGFDYEQFEKAHKNLLKQGILQKEYIARQQIDWGLTIDGQNAVRDCLKPWSDRLQPTDSHPYLTEQSQSKVLIGDVTETVTHRKGVEIAADRLIGGLPLIRDGYHGQPFGADLYPTGTKDETLHDIHITTFRDRPDYGVEVITDNNNRMHFVKKWKGFKSDNRVTIWIFKNRTNIKKMLNKLDTEGVISIEGKPFSGTRSNRNINRKLQRATNNSECQNIIQTITSLFNRGSEPIREIRAEQYPGPTLRCEQQTLSDNWSMYQKYLL
jgi:hypothetical protein